MSQPMVVCVDPDAIDTHKGRWLEIDMWLEEVVTVRAFGNGRGGPRISPVALVADDPCPSDEACLGGLAA